MAKLYKAVDKKDGQVSGFLVNQRGVAISPWWLQDKEKIQTSKNCEPGYVYNHISEFEKRAIDPVLIAEW